MRWSIFILILTVFVASSTEAFTQGNPTGSIRGVVSDPDGLPLPGVTVTAVSPALQGSRTTTTSANGDFFIPFLPPGNYTVTFDLPGFRPEKQTAGVAMAETQPMTIRLALAGITESVTVTDTSSTEVLMTNTLAETYKAQDLELLPIGRTLNDAVLLAPNVNNNGPQQSDGSRNITVSGALSYENLFLIDGVDVNENLRGQALSLFVEDAIQETKVSSGAISAEYGRFEGGVVNMITKSGGNNFSGSFRTTFTNDAWRSLTPFPGDQKISSVTPTYEMTLGGPVFKDKLWFFAAGRYNDFNKNRTTDFTSQNYPNETEDKRYEAKVTYALTDRHNLKASYTKRMLQTNNNSFGTIMDLASLYNSGNDLDLKVFNYTGLLSAKLSIEGQYSQKNDVRTGTGSMFSDLVKGTPIWDRSRGQARFNSPTFCNVCGGGWLERRDNWDAFGKISYFLSTGKAGSHSLVGGFDRFQEKRKNNNWQSGSSYRIQATSSIIDASGSLFPVFNSNNSTYIEYLPLVADSLGNKIRTSSSFINDAWHYNDRLSFNLGLRFDLNRSSDQTGLPVVKDSKWSPRLAVSWDLDADRKWIVNAGYARYVMAMSTAIVDAGSAGGRTATYSYFYQGPAINTGAGSYLTAAQALPILFDWFFANGGLARATRTAPSIPGFTTQVGSSLKAPNANEYTVGLAHEIGGGTWRVDYVQRTYADMYGDFRNITTGKVTDPTGRAFDLTTVKNTPDASRDYKGVTANVTYRLRSMLLGGNYTLSWSRGNVDGENSGSGPIRATINDFPEYRQQRWNTPYGYSPNDQRHKVRMWLSYLVPDAHHLGSVTLGLVQRLDSALPFDANQIIDTRPYVTNPGYITPPSSVTYYFSGRNGLRFDNIWTTDLSLYWSKKAPKMEKAETFFRGIVSNIFNNSGQLGGDSTVLTAASPGTAVGLQPFNPFTTTPVEGVNYLKSSSFGKPSGTTDYQTPRTFNFSIGIRF
jgi:hypothetical protein